MLGAINQGSSPEFKLAVGKILERQRKAKNFSQKYVAVVAGVRQNAIHEYECGSMTPSLSVLLRLIYLLEIRTAELMGCLKYDFRTKAERLAAGSKAPFDSKGSPSLRPERIG